MRTPRQYNLAFLGLILLAALSATLSLVGCSYASSQPRHQPPATSVNGAPTDRGTASKSDAASAEVVLPIDAYQLTSLQQAQVDSARSLAIGYCVRSHGFTFDASAALAQAKAGDEASALGFGIYENLRRYGITSKVVASKYGYHLPSIVDGSQQRPNVRNPHGLGSVTPALEIVLYGRSGAGATPATASGIPTGGCIGQVDREFGPALAQATQPSSKTTTPSASLVAQIAADSYNRSLTDTAVTAAFAAWSRCMGNDGYDYATPRVAGDNYDTDTARPTPAEIRTAEADVACKARTNLVTIWSSFETRYQNQQIDKYAQQLAQVKRANEKAIRHAVTVATTGH